MKLINEFKNLAGSVLGIGYINDKYLKELNKNDAISVDLLTSNLASATKKSLVAKEIRKDKKKGKSVYIKKIKKVFKRHKPDYIICNVDDVNNYLKSFIKDSLYITKDKLFIFSEENKVDLDELFNKYKRYNKSIEKKDKYLIIDNTNYKNNILKNIWYYIIDTFIAIYDYIGTILAS